MSKIPEDKYVLLTGKQGERQLDALDRTFGVESRKFLNQLHIANRKLILDVGCGTANLAIWMAQQVHGSGRVIAVDENKDQLDIAKEKAKKLGVNNIQFTQASAYDLSTLPTNCDFVYCRWLLIHLTQPKLALVEMSKRVAKGGILACEEATSKTRFNYPSCRVIHKVFSLTEKIFIMKKCDVNIGVHLYKMIHQLAGFDARIQFSQSLMTELEELKDYFQRLKTLLISVKATLLDLNIASEDEINLLISEIESKKPQRGDLVVNDRLSQVWGIREK